VEVSLKLLIRGEEGEIVQKVEDKIYRECAKKKIVGEKDNN